MLKVFDFLSDLRIDEDGKKVRNGYKIAEFRNDWQRLDDTSKAQLIAGVADGTYNY